MHLAGGTSEAHKELEGEPAYTHGLHQEEGVVENTVWKGHVLGYILCLGVILVKIFLRRRKQNKYIKHIIQIEPLLQNQTISLFNLS